MTRLRLQVVADEWMALYGLVLWSAQSLKVSCPHLPAATKSAERVVHSEAKHTHITVTSIPSMRFTPR